MFRNFSVISKISVRNLVRQKRRNILLGVCIVVSMAVLVLTSSFTNGLSDIIFNKLMVLMTGHITVQGQALILPRANSGFNPHTPTVRAELHAINEQGKIEGQREDNIIP